MIVGTLLTKSNLEFGKKWKFPRFVNNIYHNWGFYENATFTNRYPSVMCLSQDPY